MGSKRSTTNSNPTTNYADNRSVVDAGGGIVGTGNQWDQSVRNIDNSATSWDSSNRSTNSSTWADNSATSWDSSNRSTNTNTSNWADNSTTSWDGSNRSTTSWDGSNRSTNSSSWDGSNRSTNSSSWADNSDRSSASSWADNSTASNTVTVTDGGAIDAIAVAGRAQTEAAQRVAVAGLDAARDASARAIAAAEAANTRVTSSAGDSLRAALGFAETTTAQTFKSNREALGMGYENLDRLAGFTGSIVQAAQRQADNAASTAKAAFTSAQDGANGNRTLIYAGLAVVAVVFLMSRKG